MTQTQDNTLDGFEEAYDLSHYYVSKDGNVISMKVGYPRPMTLGVNKDGHIYVHLFLPSKKTIHKFVHHMVLETFVGPRPDGMECRHLDGIPSNNRLDNLVWGTKSENAIDMLKHGVHPTQQDGYSKRLSEGLRESYKRRGGHTEETKTKMRKAALKRYEDPAEHEKSRQGALRRYGKST